MGHFATQIGPRSLAGAVLLALATLAACVPASNAAAISHAARRATGQFLAPGSASNFGASVAISGSIAVAGASGVNNFSGAVHVYVHTSSGWHQQALLKDPGGHADAYFGQAVAVSGTTLVVGAPGGNNHLGAAYVYVQSGSRWYKVATLRNPSPIYSEFGVTAAMSGSVAVIGAPGSANGAAFIYSRSGSTWTLQQILTDPSGRTGTAFSAAVAVSGGTAVIGAIDERRVYGAAFIYVRSGSTWHRQQTINASQKIYLGAGTAISSGTIVLGAVGAASNHGALYVYIRSGSRWRQQAKVANPTKAAYGLFGYEVAISGDRILASGQTASTIKCGFAWEFIRSGTTWRARAKVIDPKCQRNDGYGAGLAVSGKTAIIGAPGANNGAGAAYLQALP